eukprot:6608205-Pyramimonas_sp.AAC.1
MEPLRARWARLGKLSGGFRGPWKCSGCLKRPRARMGHFGRVRETLENLGRRLGHVALMPCDNVSWHP